MNILEEAQSLVDGDKQQDYGDISSSFNHIASLWSAHLAAHNVVLSSHDVAIMMILLKTARAATGGLKRDTYVDIAGYAYCIDKMYLSTPDEVKE